MSRHHRNLVGGSLDTDGVQEFRTALKKFGYTHNGTLRGSYVNVDVLNSAGEIVGNAGHGGHGDLAGIISPNREAFEIDYVDDVVRLQERLARRAQEILEMEPEEGYSPETWGSRVDRSLQGYMNEINSLDKSIELRIAHFAGQDISLLV